MEVNNENIVTLTTPVPSDGTEDAREGGSRSLIALFTAQE